MWSDRRVAIISIEIWAFTVLSARIATQLCPPRLKQKAIVLIRWTGSCRVVFSAELC
jgi:hypothetical protein